MCGFTFKKNVFSLLSIGLSSLVQAPEGVEKTDGGSTGDTKVARGVSWTYVMDRAFKDGGTSFL